jgi:putative transposase
LELKPKSEIDLETINWHKFVTRQFGNFFNAYAKAINKRFNRRGALFEDDIKRPQIDTEAYFLRTLRYIHQNPIHHGFVTSLEDWDFTSYSAYLSTLKTGLYKTEVLNRFGNLQTFCEFHQDFRILLEFDGMD